MTDPSATDHDLASELAIDGDDGGVSAEELDSAQDQAEPLDLTAEERKLVTQPYDLGVLNLSQDISRGRLKLNVEYQRKYVWDPGKASRLIESLLLNVPVPVCYFAEDDDGSYEVIDGLQRLTTIDRFLRDEFKLTGISVLSELKEKTFSQLSPKDQRRLENRTIRCIVITAESHPDIKFDVFERLNTGSASLSAQELRNCIYRGPFNDELKKLASAVPLTQVLGTKKNSRMENEELVLRFFALSSDIVGYKPPLRQLLNTYMRKHRTSTPTSAEVQSLLQTCEVVSEVFGSTPFLVPGADGKVHRTVNKALFDSIMISFYFADSVQLKANAPQVRDIRNHLLKVEEFQQSIGRATADRTRMFYRIDAFTQLLRSIGIMSALPDLQG